MRTSFWSLLLLLCIAINSTAQSRMAELVTNTPADTHLTISSSVFDNDSNLVHAGVYGGATAGTSPAIIKTDRWGNRIWAKYIVYSNGATGSAIGYRVKIASNGDYLVLSYGVGALPGLIRMTPSGTLLYAKQYLYGLSQKAYRTLALTELSNGNIAIVGSNDFHTSSGTSSSYLEPEGFLAIIDQSGNPVHFLALGYNPNNSTATQQFHFNSITSSGNRIFIGGAWRVGAGTLLQPAIISMDTVGGNPVIRKMPALTIAGNYYDAEFDHIALVRNKLVVSGPATMNYYTTKYIVARVDTDGTNMTGVIAEQPYPDPYPNRDFYPYEMPGVYAKDTADWYLSFCPAHFVNGTFQPRKKILLEHFTHDTLAAVKKLQFDSSIALLSTTFLNDTAVMTGIFYKAGGVSSGLFERTELASISGTTCNRSDTVAVSTPFATTLYAGTTPAVNTYGLSGLNYISIPLCAHEMHLCGSAPCPPMQATVTALTATHICAGDTARLLSGDCYHKSWYKNGVPLGSHADVLSVTTSGSYSAVIDNGLCYDTSASFDIVVDTPQATITQQGDTLFANNSMSYQWCDSACVAISGATDGYFLPPTSGYYILQTTDSNGCIARSLPYDYAFALSAGVIYAAGQSIRIYPNPASTQFTIGRSIPGQLSVSLFDQTGRPLGTYIQNDLSASYSIKSLGLAPGIYFLQLKIDNSLAGRRVLMIY